MDLENKRVLITGASRGIGAALADSFASAGATVLLVARSKDAIAAKAERLEGKAYPADLTDLSTLGEFIDGVLASGPIDVLVNNAGVDHTDWVVCAPVDNLQHTITLNLVVPITLCRLVLPHMLQNENGGHVVNVSSMASSNPLPGMATYAASKAGLSHFTAGLRADLDGLPVSTTLVELGTVATEMVENARSYKPTQDAFARLERLKLLPPDMTPEFVADAVVAAVSKNRRHVRLPSRGSLFPMMTEGPRRMTELALRGVKAQPDYQGDAE
ncbi:MAG: SDR family NAD(P)-dependent oxidoreductase [Acidimicrobiales bacterium]